GGADTRSHRTRSPYGPPSSSARTWRDALAGSYDAHGTTRAGRTITGGRSGAPGGTVTYRQSAIAWNPNASTAAPVEPVNPTYAGPTPWITNATPAPAVGAGSGPPSRSVNRVANPDASTAVALNTDPARSGASAVSRTQKTSRAADPFVTSPAASTNPAPYS